MKNKKLFTSESVSEGHPDKVCDQISDAVLDACLKIDPHARVACEVLATSKKIVITGEISLNLKKKFFVEIARKVLSDIKYSKEFFLDPYKFPIEVIMNKQSEDISQSVVNNDVVKGAGDQGIMFGYATDETPEGISLSLQLAHEILHQMATYRKWDPNSSCRLLGPDSKSQVTIDYSGKKPKIHTVLVSTQHKNWTISERDYAFNGIRKLVKSIAIKRKLNLDYKLIINPSGKFIIGGPVGDTGLTGRKIIVDSYGGAGRHGGGAFSGKDPSKVDRSAAYMARWIAKNLVFNKVAKEVEIQLSYGIGMPKPISISINTFGKSKYSEQEIIKIINKNFDLSVNGMINQLNLKRPLYYQVAKYGHFGRNELNVPWEKVFKLKGVK